MSGKLKKIKEELKEAGTTTSGHVIMLIISSQYWPMKIIFLLAWLAGFGFTIFLIIDSIQDYYKYDVTTQTRLIREQSMIFPKITICNADRFVTDDSISFLANVLRNDMNLSKFVNAYSTAGASTDLALVNRFITDNVYFQSQALYAAFSADNTTRMSLGYDKETFIKSCVFNSTPCGHNFIEQIYDIKLGNCFTFNGQNKSHINSSGNLINLFIFYIAYIEL